MLRGEFYRFLVFPQKNQVAELRLSKRAVEIRLAVENQSTSLTSDDILFLMNALKPHGAHFIDRSNGIMLKLPAIQTSPSVVAKFIHRSHPYIDRHSVKALKDLFAQSTFSMEKFLPSAP